MHNLETHADKYVISYLLFHWKKCSFILKEKTKQKSFGPKVSSFNFVVMLKDSIELQILEMQCIMIGRCWY